MAASSSVGAVVAPPQLTVWQYNLSAEEIEQVEASLQTLAGRTVVSQMIAFAFLYPGLWLQAALRVPEGTGF